MKWFGFGKKKRLEQETRLSPKFDSPQPQQPLPKFEGEEIVVYGTGEDRRCDALRELLDQSGYTYLDERVDDDLSTRAWLQRTTGNDALPKLFVGTQYCGTFEDIQALALNGELDRILSGRTAREQEDRKRLRAQMSVDSISQLLRDGESLVINEDGVETETWLEPPRQPTQILLEGVAYPIEEMKSIVTRIVERHKRGDISLSWRSDED
jgi:glutaredoxin